MADGGEPECYDEALQDENSSKWELAMKDEMDSLLENQTWELTELPVGKKALHNKWILRYLKGSLDTCLCFTGATLKLQGYVDADFAGDIDSRKSTIGFVLL